MKKLFLAVLPLLALGMTACGGDDSSSTPAPSSSSSAPMSSSSVPSSSEGSSSEASSSGAGGANVVDVYLANGGQDLSYWTNDEAVTYAYVWNGEGDAATDKLFLPATFVEFYEHETVKDEAYFTVDFGNGIRTEHILLLRCDPAKITAAPQAWPEDGVWNQSTDGSITERLDPETSAGLGTYCANVSVKTANLLIN